MKRIIITIAALVSICNANAQSQNDIENIKKLTGCFHVTFNYAETFTNDTTNKFQSGKLNDHAVVELAYIIEESPKSI